MSARQYLTEPWGVLAAGLFGGLGGAVAAALGPQPVLGLPVGVAIAAVVFGVRVGLGELTDRASGAGLAAAVPADLPVPPPGSPAAAWLARAEAAVDNLRRLTGPARDPVLAAQVGAVAGGAVAALSDLRLLAGRVTLIERAAAGIGARRLRAEHDDLRGQLLGLPDGPLRAERERAVSAVADQLAVCDRLERADETLLARMQSVVFGLEGLGARTAELIALHVASDAGTFATADLVAELTGDLEGLRTGLAEAEELSRAALTAGALPRRP